MWEIDLRFAPKVACINLLRIRQAPLPKRLRPPATPRLFQNRKYLVPYDIWCLADIFSTPWNPMPFSRAVRARTCS